MSCATNVTTSATQITKTNKEHYDMPAYGNADTESSIGGVEEYINRSFVTTHNSRMKKTAEITNKPFDFINTSSHQDIEAEIRA